VIPPPHSHSASKRSSEEQPLRQPFSHAHHTASAGRGRNAERNERNERNERPDHRAPHGGVLADRGGSRRSANHGWGGGGGGPGDGTDRPALPTGFDGPGAAAGAHVTKIDFKALIAAAGQMDSAGGREDGDKRSPRSRPPANGAPRGAAGSNGRHGATSASTSAAAAAAAGKPARSNGPPAAAAEHTTTMQYGLMVRTPNDP